MVQGIVAGDAKLAAPADVDGARAELTGCVFNSGHVFHKNLAAELQNARRDVVGAGVGRVVVIPDRATESALEKCRGVDLCAEVVRLGV